MASLAHWSAGSSEKRRRRRPLLVCIPCNEKKIKCDLCWPECTQCSKSLILCSWDSKLYGPKGPYESTLRRQHRRLKRTALKTMVSKDEGSPLGKHGTALGLHGGSEAGVPQIIKTNNIFSSMTSFMMVIGCLEQVHDVMTCSILGLEELNKLKFLWQSYVYSDSGAHALRATHVSSYTHRMSFYNSFCALASFSHGCHYMPERAGAALGEKTTAVTWALAMEAASMIDSHDDRLTGDLVASFVVMGKLTLYGGPPNIMAMQRMFATILRVVQRQYGDRPSTFLCPDILTLLEVAEALTLPPGDPGLALALFKRWCKRHENDLRSSDIRGWDRDRLRGFGVSVVFIGELVISTLIYNGGRFVPYDGQPPEVLEIIEAALLTIRLGIATMKTVDTPVGQKHALDTMLSSLCAVCAFILNYCGAPQSEVVPLMNRAVDFFMNDKACHHPFNTPAFGPLTVALTCVHDIRGPAALHQILGPLLSSEQLDLLSFVGAAFRSHVMLSQGAVLSPQMVRYHHSRMQQANLNPAVLRWNVTAQSGEDVHDSESPPASPSPH